MGSLAPVGQEPELIDVNKDHLASLWSLITGDKSVNADTGLQSPVKGQGTGFGEDRVGCSRGFSSRNSWTVLSWNILPRKTSPKISQLLFLLMETLIPGRGSYGLA